MIAREFVLGFLLLITLQSSVSAQTNRYAQIDTVLGRYRSELFKTHQTLDIEWLMRSLQEDHESAYGHWAIWPDIDYNDESRSDWQLLKHLKRVENFAIAWSNPDSRWYHQDTLWQDISMTLDYWLFHRFYNPNWYPNEISVPGYMQSILVLLGPHLTHYQRVRCFEEMNQYRINGTGSNLIQSAKLGFYYGALTKDTSLMRHCMDAILREIKINTGEGIQPDYSFHMHLNRLQIYSYGRSYLKPILELAMQCRGTTWAFPPGKIELLTDFILKGWQWMCRGANTAPGTIDRGISRKGALHAADIRSMIPPLIELSPGKKPELISFERRQNGTGVPLAGFRYYPYSDFAAYQNKNFSFFLKTISTRTLPSESINGENLKGHLLNSGDAYLIRDGLEYYNLMPVWNWDKLPGITSFDGAERMLRKPFAGSVSDGKSGLTAMDYELEGKDTLQSIRAHKFWAVHNGLVICLISGLQGNGVQGDIFTVLDQCRLQGSVVVNNVSEKVGEGTHLLNNVEWIYHNGFSYIPIKPATIRLQTGLVRGTWKSISSSASDSLVTDSVFMPVMMHGRHLQNLSAGYVLTYGETAEKTAYLAGHPAWKIWRNDDSCQAVQFSDGTLMVAFFSSGNFTIKNDLHVSVDKPSLILLSHNTIFISDPTHRGGKIRVSVNRHKLPEIDLPDDGSTVQETI